MSIFKDARTPRLVAVAVGVLPLTPLTLMTTTLLRSVSLRKPEILERLGSHAGKRFGLQAADLPLAFVLEPLAKRAAAMRRVPRDVDVRITGSLVDLVGLVNGDCDGDALFFARRLSLEGDVEAALALRNAIDDARLDFAAEAASMIPFLGGLGVRGVQAAAAFTRTVRRPLWS